MRDLEVSLVVAFRNGTDSGLIVSLVSVALRKALRHLNHGELIDNCPLDILLVLLFCAQPFVGLLEPHKAFQRSLSDFR